jgi:DNA helicase HerA-like ATPase
MPIVIGSTSSGDDVAVNLDVLVRTRGLITANSGGGKSYLIRKLLEEVYGKVQAIVIDPEGEFSTLREKYGYVLVGADGETPADVAPPPWLPRSYWSWAPAPSATCTT